MPVNLIETTYKYQQAIEGLNDPLSASLNLINAEENFNTIKENREALIRHISSNNFEGCDLGLFNLIDAIISLEAHLKKPDEFTNDNKDTFQSHLETLNSICTDILKETKVFNQELIKFIDGKFKELSDDKQKLLVKLGISTPKDYLPNDISDSQLEESISEYATNLNDKSPVIKEYCYKFVERHKDELHSFLKKPENFPVLKGLVINYIGVDDKIKEEHKKYMKQFAELLKSALNDIQTTKRILEITYFIGNTLQNNKELANAIFAELGLNKHPVNNQHNPYLRIFGNDKEAKDYVYELLDPNYLPDIGSYNISMLSAATKASNVSLEDFKILVKSATKDTKEQALQYSRDYANNLEIEDKLLSEKIKILTEALG